MSVERGQRKADKNDCCAQKCGWNDLWVNGRHVANQTTQTDAFKRDRCRGRRELQGFMNHCAIEGNMRLLEALLKMLTYC